MTPSPAKVPVNLITGFLGVGKTSAIRHLLASKPAERYWAVLVNEFGQVGIDGAALAGDADDIQVVEVPGGCICCTTSPLLAVSIARLLQRRRPQRLILEASGLGHPSGMIDALRRPELAKGLELRATIALLDPRHLDDARYQLSDIWRDQIQLADVLVANKCDRADAAQIDRFQAMAAASYPPKQAQVTTSQGRFDPALLDLASGAATPAFRRIQPAAADRTGHEQGWIWPAEQRFSAEGLAQLFQALHAPQQWQLPPLRRAKGVFHTDAGWLLFNWVDGEASATEIAWRRDSRCEFILAQAADDWTALAGALEACCLADGT